MPERNCSDRRENRLDPIESLGEGSAGDPGAYKAVVERLGDRVSDCECDISEHMEELEEGSGRCPHREGSAGRSGATR